MTGVCSTAKVDLVRSLGADHVIDYTQEDFTRTRPQYDLILDMGGNRSLSQLRRALRPGGTLVSVGSEQGNRWVGGRGWIQAMLLSRFVKSLRPLASEPNQADLVFLTRLIETDKVTPVIDKNIGTSSRLANTLRRKTVQNQMEPTVSNRLSRNNYRTTARAVGVVFLAGMAVYILGNAVLVEPILSAPDHLAAVAANSLPLAIGAMLMLMAAVGDTLHGILMLPVLRRHNERVAFGYFGARLIDAVFLAVGIMFLLLQIPLGRAYLAAGAPEASSLQALSTLSIEAHLYSYEIGMIAVGFAGLMLCYLFYTARLVSRLLAVWGLIGYAVLLTGSVLTVLGFHPGLIHTIPGGLWELFIGVWLIAKGFNSPQVSSKPNNLTIPTVASPPVVSTSV